MWKKIVFLLLLCGCIRPIQTPGKIISRPSEIAEANAAISRDDWGDAEVILGHFLMKNPTGYWACEAHYLIGICYLKNYDLSNAEDEFQFVAMHTSSSRLGRQSKIRIGDVALASQDYNKASDIYSRLLQTSRHFKDGSELMFKLGFTRQRQGKWNEAEAIFRRTRQKFPGTLFANRAAEQLTLPHHFSLQIGAFQSKESADKKQDLLAKQGYTAFVHKLVHNRHPLFCVRIGVFPTRQEALQFKYQMRNNSDLKISSVVP